MESGRWMNFFCHSMQRQEDSPPATDCRLGDGPCISTCALLVESDGGGRKTWRYIMEFQSTLSLRRATGYYQSCHQIREISIHALLAESDMTSAGNWWVDTTFQSTLSLRRATLSYLAVVLGGQFQSTLSLRRATSSNFLRPSGLEFQSTLSLRRATRKPPRYPHGSRNFNPRSPCGERLYGL